MRIAYIAAGAAGMYCGSCLHDNTLAAGLMQLGEDVVLLPTYTPVRTDEENVSHGRVFFGGINVYLQQKSALFRHTPWWLDRLLDHPAILQRLAGRAVSIDSSQLGDLTVSMLKGEAGRQRKEVEKLASWLENEFQPDVVHLSNAMLTGMAHTLLETLQVPIVCSLSGEDVFLERLRAPFYEQARDVLQERVRDVDALVALNRYYADYMVQYLAIPPERVHVIRHGLDLKGYAERTARRSDGPPTIGYFARICEDKGLHVLVEACEILARERPGQAFWLRAAGYLGAAERAYLKDLETRVQSGPLRGRFEYLGELDRPGKIAYLQSLDVFSVPTVYRESKGLPALEALASAVPVVLPEHGSFPELICDTGGGLLHRPLDAADLANKLSYMLENPAEAAAMGHRGRAAVIHRYHARAMASQTRDLYQSLLGKKSVSPEIAYAAMDE
jgi:glycosyltransferase involved in cell wall biosynthesis